MKHQVSKSSVADFVSREHLVRLLVEQIERTFATEGRDQALQAVAHMLRRLDEAALRALVYRQGGNRVQLGTVPRPSRSTPPRAVRSAASC